MDPFLAVGFSRPLEKEGVYIPVPARLNASLTIPRLDFWALPDYRLTGYLTERVEKAFYISKTLTFLELTYFVLFMLGMTCWPLPGAPVHKLNKLCFYVFPILV